MRIIILLLLTSCTLHRTPSEPPTWQHPVVAVDTVLRVKATIWLDEQSGMVQREMRDKSLMIYCIRGTLIQTSSFVCLKHEDTYLIIYRSGKFQADLPGYKR